MSSVIVDPLGRPATRGTETRFNPKLIEQLMALSDLLHQNGLGLFCMRCHRTGESDGVEAKETEDEYRMTCGCATRVFKKKTGHERVFES